MMVRVTRTTFTCVALTVLASTTATLRAQVVPPFIGGGAVAFSPEIGIVNSGVVADVTATVSHDRKYVTLTMGVSNSALIALQEFTFQRDAGAAAAGAGGFVGELLPVGANAQQQQQQQRQQVNASILSRPGMTLIAPLR